MKDKLDCIEYQSDEDYINNSIGFNENGEYFCGEMSAIYFVNDTPMNIHKFLYSLYRTITMNDHDFVLSNNQLKGKLSNKISSIDGKHIDILKNAFFVINPKFISENLEAFGKEKNAFMVNNGIYAIEKYTQIHSNNIGRIMFTNIGGIKTLLPILEQIYNRSEERRVGKECLRQCR